MCRPDAPTVTPKAANKSPHLVAVAVLRATQRFLLSFASGMPTVCHQDPGLNRREVLETYAEYGERQEKAYGGQWLACRRKLAKPVWHLFHGEKNGKKFRQALGGP